MNATDHPRPFTWLEYYILLPLMMWGERMFALIALLCFVIAQFEASLGDIDLMLLGLAFFAAHFLFGVSLTPWRKQ